VARALKAGNTFNQRHGRWSAQEFGDPLRRNSTKTLEEINFGVHAHGGPGQSHDPVDCPDLNFIVVSLKIQSETGGNLAEIVENIASLIRERFKLRGRIRILSAEGRFAAIVLTILPFGVSAAIQFTNPGYLALLFTHHVGRMILWIVGG
jgi:tight adherence protein B